MANTNSIEKVILNNKNASSHPQLASMLSEYTAAVASGYVVPTAMIVAILNLAPTNTTALANLNALKTQLHSSGFINDTPVAVNDTLVATEDTAVTYTAAQLLGNDTDVDGDTLTIAAVTSGAGGTAVLNGNGTVTFTPNANFNGAASFTYTTSDGSATSNSALVTVNVAAVNDAPVAVADTLSATEDTAVTYTAAQLLGNDTDVDNTNAQLSIFSVTSGTGGTAVLNGNGTVTFTPNANFNGVAHFTYTTSDGAAQSNSASVTVNVAAVNDAPVAVADTLSATEDTAVTYTAAQLLGNDTDVDNTNAQLSIFSVTSGAGGVAVLNADGTVTFTPGANFNGAASFSYTASDGSATSNSASVTVNVAAVNDAPVANPDTLTATEDTAATYTAAQLLGNDTDVDNTNVQLSIASVTSGTGGAAVLNADGTVTFTPNANFNGAASFTYTTSDGSATSNSASVTVNVAAVNDAPVAVADTLTATEDTPVTYTAAQLLGNDTDVDNTNAQLSIASVTSGTGGTAVLNGNGTVTFTPTLNFNGAADFSYTASDGQATSAPATVTVNVAAVNDAPVAVADTLSATEDTPVTYTAAQLLGNDTDVDNANAQLSIASVTSGTGGTAALNVDGTVTFTPNANFNGAADFTYTASDGAAQSNSATVTVNVAAVNDAPVAVADTLSATEDTAVTYTAAQLLGNDTDVDGDTLTIFSVASGTDGVAVLNADGTLSFTPGANFNGAADFSYTASDGSATSNSATVTVNVAAVNDAPVAVADTLAATEDTAATYTAAQLLGNDTDVDNTNAQLSIASVASGTGGTAVLNLDGTVTFTPGANFNGAADFSYTASDGQATSAPATVTVNVAAVNDAPVNTVPGAQTVNQNTNLSITGLSVSDVDAGSASITTTLSVAHGTLTVASMGGATVAGSGTGSVTLTGSQTAIDTTLAASNNVVYRGSLNFNGSDTLTVTTNDNGNTGIDPGLTDGATAEQDVDTVAINVTAVNVAAPVFDLTFLGATQGFIIQGDTASDLAGFSVASAGDVNGDGFADLIVGAPYGDDGGLYAGEAYVVFGKSTGFGTAVVLGGVSRQVIDLTSLSATDGFIIQGDTAGDQAGRSVASAGDVNGDGFADLIMGAPFGDDGGNAAGEAYVLFGKSAGFGTTVNTAGFNRQVIDLTSLSASGGFIIQGDTAVDQAGFSVASAGDVNGDGYTDLIVGAIGGDDGGNAAGEAYVLFGKSAGFGTTVNTAGFNRQVIDLTSLSASGGFIIQGDTAGDQAGFSVASAGDVNGDGFADLIVGAPYGDDGGNAAGEAYVVFGKSTGFGTAVVLGGVSRQVIDLTSLSATQGFIIQGDTALDQAGGRYSGVASAGDVNGDGFADLIVGANRGDDGGIDAGEAYVVFGKAAGFGTTVSTAGFNRQVIDLTSLSASDGFIIQGDTTGDQAGFSVASAGDVNGDGFADLIVGAPGLGVAGVNQLVTGEAYVVFGKSAGFGTVDGTGRAVIDLTSLSATEGFIIQGDSDRDQAGISVASAGDVNGDGFADLIVGARFGDDGGNGAGEAYVLFGAAFGASGTPVTTTGTAAAEIFIGGVGNDTLTGGGGADVFHAGAGHDVIAVADTSFKLADGGTGTDVLRLMGSGLTLDLTLLANNKISGIERIDLTGTGNNSLKLNLSDVLDLSDSTNQVFVNGNAGDAVTIVGTAWSNAGAETHDGIVYTLYVNGIANLLVQQDITVF